MPQSTPTAEILSQGDEVVTGQVTDTNAAWLAAQLTDLGFQVTRHTSAGDRLADLAALFTEVGARADLVVCTGGLGPTEDDLTAAAVSTAFSMPLSLQEDALADLEAKYARYGRPMPAVNRKQCVLPVGCTRLDNHWGTAPGFAVQAPRAWMAFLPGVPHEMRSMFSARVLPHLTRAFSLSPDRLITLRTTGVGESNLQQRVGEQWASDHPGVVLSFRTLLPENHLKLRVGASVPQARIHAAVADLASRIGSPLFAIEGLDGADPAAFPGVDLAGGELVQVIARALLASGHSLATAESCTGGRVASLCTGLPGSSAWFLEGAVTYSNAAKVRCLGVDPATLQQHGAVSEPVARQMAEGVRARSGAHFGLSTTGIAGPGGGSQNKPVGTVHISVASPDRTEHQLLHLPGTRHRIQALAASSVLDLLRRTFI